MKCLTFIIVSYLTICFVIKVTVIKVTLMQNICTFVLLFAWIHRNTVEDIQKTEHIAIIRRKELRATRLASITNVGQNKTNSTVLDTHSS